MLGSLILCLKGVRTTMFQLSGFYYRCLWGSGSLLGILQFIGVGLRDQSLCFLLPGLMCFLLES